MFEGLLCVSIPHIKCIIYGAVVVVETEMFEKAPTVIGCQKYENMAALYCPVSTRGL